MSIDLVVANGINETPQPVMDQSENSSALQIATDLVVVGNGTPVDYLQVLGVIATPPPNACHVLLGNPGATSNAPSSSLTFAGFGIDHAGFFWVPVIGGASRLALAFGGNNDPSQNTTQFIFNSDGTVAFQGLPNLPGTGTTDLTIDSAGNITPQTSSLRFKDNVELLNEDFQKILALEPKSFTYKDTGCRGIGYAAEDLDELKLSDLVGYDADNKPLSINYKLIPIYMLEVLKEQQKVISELQTEVADLKSSPRK